MRSLYIIGLLLFSNYVFAQNTSGFVKDAVTRLPIANAQVITVYGIALTNSFGQFNIAKLKLGEKIAVRIMGYETAELTISNATLTDSIYFYLQQSIFQLNEVSIKTNRNYKLDSLKLRKEFANIFAYKAPGFTNMFVNVNPDYRPPLALVRPNSTASIINFNVLKAFSLLGQKKKSTVKLKQTLLKDEEINYVSRSFSKEKIASVTPLKGDSLILFMNQYRPDISTIKKMTGYELIQYIKRCYAKFIKPEN